MPSYEMPLLLRVMSKPETVATLKRAAQTIFDKGGFIRQIDNLGKKPTPFKITNHGKKFTEAQVFLYHFDAPPSQIQVIYEEYLRDVDIIRQQIFNKESGKDIEECLLHEETLPAPYRKDVQKMMILAKRKTLRDNFQEKYFKNLKDFPFKS